MTLDILKINFNKFGKYCDIIQIDKLYLHITKTYIH